MKTDPVAESAHFHCKLPQAKYHLLPTYLRENLILIFYLQSSQMSDIDSEYLRCFGRVNTLKINTGNAWVDYTTLHDNDTF